MAVGKRGMGVVNLGANFLLVITMVCGITHFLRVCDFWSLIFFGYLDIHHRNQCFSEAHRLGMLGYGMI